ncbi:uncharacterized protein LOC116298501 [Actinia tenebrosa]|uniref:Uncharacterized protein LOC116298501 n=1 Tax=Actinia tenebrosa TaxID=6105 RepID=A0A6P8I2U7_ACTTE|nr:uncharacterized protein LOC116298501 [Actinia tenebrosa]
MAMKENTIIYLALLFPSLCNLNTSTDEAIPLITVQKNGDEAHEFILNPDAISMMKQVSSPVKIIAAIGDARVGKSTALNFIHYTLSNVSSSASDTKNVEEIFVTGDTMNPVTHGVWIAKPNGMNDVILLDVAGVDPGLMLFMKESPSNHTLEFLYKIVRLSEEAFGTKKSEYFPRLTAVLRGALKPPQGYENIDQYITDALITAKWKDESDDQRDAIRTRFPKDHITVFNIPYDASTPKYLKTPKQFLGSEYLESIENLTQHLFELPEKKSLGGAVLDGPALAELAKNLVKDMNDKTRWNDLNPSFYSLFEENLCRKSYEKYIEPLLRLRKAEDMETQKDEKLMLFKENCKLPKCIIQAEIDIDKAITLQKERERQQNDFVTNLKIVVLIAAAVAMVAVVAPVVVVPLLNHFLSRFLSDAQLKENITVLYNSEYETIGLRGVEWVWNKEAERLGLSGKESGVVAQEVELLYPWAVTEGHDGYQQVNYLALRLLIWTKKFQQKAVKT